MEQTVQTRPEVEYNLPERPSTLYGSFALLRSRGLESAQHCGCGRSAEVGLTSEASVEVSRGQALLGAVFAQDPVRNAPVPGAFHLLAYARDERGREDRELARKAGESDGACILKCFPAGRAVGIQREPASQGAGEVAFKVCQGLRVELRDFVLVSEADGGGYLVVRRFPFVIQAVGPKAQRSR